VGSRIGRRPRRCRRRVARPGPAGGGEWLDAGVYGKEGRIVHIELRRQTHRRQMQPVVAGMSHLEGIDGRLGSRAAAGQPWIAGERGRVRGHGNGR
jgi:hypothetical protein